MTRPLRVSTGRPIVVDSSVAFKWFDTSEPGSDEAVALAREHGRDEVALVAPAHLPLEVMNVHASRGTPPAQIESAIEALAQIDVLLAPIDDSLLVDAARIAHAERLTLYDAAFVALAARLDAELVTADRRQAATKACRIRLIGQALPACIEPDDTKACVAY